MKECNEKHKHANNKDYICNPETGRWVKRGGAAHKKFLKKQNPVKKTVKKILNPKTGKLIVKGGSTHKKLIKERKKKISEWNQKYKTLNINPSDKNREMLIRKLIKEDGTPYPEKTFYVYKKMYRQDQTQGGYPTSLDYVIGLVKDIEKKNKKEKEQKKEEKLKQMNKETKEQKAAKFAAAFDKKFKNKYGKCGKKH